MFRDIDLISTCLADKRLVATKCSQFANQVTDPNLKTLLQDVASIHQRHVSILSQAQGRFGMQAGAGIGAGQQPMYRQ